MTTKKLNVRVTQKGAKKAEKEQRKLGTSIAATIGKYVAMGVAVRAVGGVLIDSIKLYATQELAEKKLATALGKTSKALLHQASALQRNSVYGDELIIEAQALIAAFVKEESHIKAATKATLDLAAAKGFDLVAAADLVSKTLGSSTNALTRYGIEVKGAVGSTERLRSLTENLGKAFGGQAKAQAGTLGGQIQQLSNMYGDLKEDLGETLAPTVMVGAAMGKTAVETVKSIGVFKLLEWRLGGITMAMDLAHKGAKKLMKAIVPEPRWTVSFHQRTKEDMEKLIPVISDTEKAYRSFRKERLKSITDAEQLLAFEKRLNKEFAISTDLAAKPSASPIKPMIEDLKTVSEMDLTVNVNRLDTAVSQVATNITAKYQNIANMTSSLIGDSMIAAFTRGESAAQAFVDAFKRMLLRLATQTAVYGLLSMLIPGNIFGKAVGGLGGFLGFAGGGDFKKGQPIKVGERGTELLIPQTAGTIVPNDQIGTSLTVNFYGNITDQRYVDDFILPRIQKVIRLGRA